MHRASFFSHPQNLDLRRSASQLERENFTGQVPCFSRRDGMGYPAPVPSLSRVLVGGTGRDIPRRCHKVLGIPQIQGPPSPKLRRYGDPRPHNTVVLGTPVPISTVDMRSFGDPPLSIALAKICRRLHVIFFIYFLTQACSHLQIFAYNYIILQA